MRSATPKVLHRVAGKTMLEHAVAAARGTGAPQIVVVVRHGRDQVASAALALGDGVVVADQDEVPGTGRAVQCALEAFSPVPDAGPVLVIPADVPLLDAPVLTALLQAHADAGNAVTLLSAVVEEPYGYGRIVRDVYSGQVAEIVEERDATQEQRAIAEINSSVYAFEPDVLNEALSRVGQANDQREVYLTDTVAIARQAGRPVAAVVLDDPRTIGGVNDREQLAQAGRLFNERLLRAAMLGGVTVQDPATTWLDQDVQLAQDVTLLPGTELRGRTRVEEGAVVGPFTTLTDCTVGAGARVDRTVATDTVIGPDAQVGPFTHLRPGTDLGAETKAGSFTELKQAVIGTGAKVPHLAYVGDAQVGEDANIGAGTIFANFDGVAKSQCEVGASARVGSNNVLVAPLSIGAGSYTGAGAIVRGDVPPGSLAVSAGSQRVIEGWTGRKRPGTASAKAAAKALSESEGPAGNGPEN
jgi:bifunctional UDP-N-acetylglucosamine pyrophosphorylase/glucosamine-1-phosphate N-acetyltransferase